MARTREAGAAHRRRATPRGEAIADRLGIRYALVDPTCTDAQGDPIAAPQVGRPVFVSERLVVLRLR